MKFQSPAYEKLAAWLIIVLFLMTPAALVGAQSGIEIKVTPAFEGNFVLGTWLPLRIEVQNNGPGFDGRLVATVPGSPSQHTATIDLPQGSQKATTLYVPMEQAADHVLVRLEQRGTTVAEQRVEVRARVGERLLGIASDQPETLPLPRRQEMQQLPFVSFALPLASLPEQPAGLRSLTALVLARNPGSRPNEQQLQSLRGWLQTGGHLIIGGGALVEQTLAALPPDLQPAQAGAAVDLNPAAIGEYVGAQGPPDFPGIQLQPAPGSIPFGDPAAPIWVQKPVGDGRVTQLAFDPVSPPLTDWAGSPAFWDRFLQPSAFVTGFFGQETSLESGRDQTLTTVVGHLPTANLPQASVLLGFLLAYAFVIGPGAALVLRRLDRQVWGWIVLPVLAFAFLGLGSGLAYSLRADQKIVSHVNLLEETGPGQARSRTVIAVLTPQNDSFQLTLPPNTLTRPIRPVSGPYGQIEGVNGSFPQSGGTTAIDIPRWKLQGLVAEQQVALPAIEATITLGTSPYEVQARNSTNTVFRDVLVAYSEQLVRLGDLQPGESKTARWSTAPSDVNAPPSGNALGMLAMRDQIEASRRESGVIQRQLLLREALINAAVQRGSLAPDPGPWVVGWLDATPSGIEVAVPGASTQQTTLVLARATLVGQGQVALPPGWLRPDFAASGTNYCPINDNRGFMARTTPLTTTLQLPSELTPFRATAMTLTLTGEGTWPNAGITTELWDWQAARWTDQDYDGPGELVVKQAERYLQHGQVRLRFQGRIAEVGCLLIRGQLGGTLP